MATIETQQIDLKALVAADQQLQEFRAQNPIIAQYEALMEARNIAEERVKVAFRNKAAGLSLQDFGGVKTRLMASQGPFQVSITLAERKGHYDPAKLPASLLIPAAISGVDTEAVKVLAAAQGVPKETLTDAWVEGKIVPGVSVKRV